MTGIPALLGSLGLVALLFGLGIFVMALFGIRPDLAWIVGNLVVGVGLLVAAVATNLDTLRERLGSGEARRAGKYGSSALAGTLLSVAIVCLLGFLATRYHWRFDWSEQKIHSLSDQTRKVLAGLEQDVSVLALFGALEVDPARQLLDKYAYESDRFRIRYADPTREPDLLAKYDVAPEELGQGVVRVAIGEESTLVDELEEEKITNALVKLTRTGVKKVYFLVGHNEHPIEDEAGEAKGGMGRAAQALRNENYEVDTLLLAAAGEVPEDADVVIAAGATRPLLDEEHAALERYLQRGGSLLVMLDPRANTDLTDDLARWGVTVGEDLVVDRALALFGRATSPFAGSYAPDHEITRDLREPALFHVVRSVSARDDAGELVEIVFTGDSSWAERDLALFFEEGRAELDPGDLRGPVPVAVAGAPRLPAGAADDGEGPAPGAEPAAPLDPAAEPDGGGDGEPQGDGAAQRQPRLAVFGDSDFAANELLDAYRNRDLFLNSVNWLLGDVEAISIRPVRARASRFQPSIEQFQTIRSLSLFLLPEAIAVVGVLVWWRRRYAAEG